MRWRQILLAAALAIGAAYAALLRLEASLLVATLAGGAVYIGTRTLIATLFRTRYWLSRGTKGAYTRRCPGCGQRIYRKRGDWIMQCHRCGWAAGRLGLRWLTHTVPSRQLRRSISWAGLGVILIATAAIVVAPAFGALPAADAGATGESGAAATDTPEEQITSTPEETQTSSSDEADRRLDRRTIERHLLRYINEERADRGLSELERDERLVKIARFHSKDMAETEYFAHESPGGETMSDRYRKFGYQCRVPVEGNRYLSGAENIAYTIAFSPVQHPTGGTVTLTTEEEIARNLVAIWMNSPPHKKNILREPWDNVGHGAYIGRVNGELRVYATQNFC